MRYLLLLLLVGCTPAKEPMFRIKDYDDQTTQFQKDPKPIQWELGDEYGIRRGWRF